MSNAKKILLGGLFLTLIPFSLGGLVSTLSMIIAFREMSQAHQTDIFTLSGHLQTASIITGIGNGVSLYLGLPLFILGIVLCVLQRTKVV